MPLRSYVLSLLLLLLLPLGSAGQVLSAKDHFLLGAAKYKCNACEEAVKNFSKAIDLQRDYSEAFYGRSLAHACLADYDRALEDIKRAIRFAPDQVLYLEARGRYHSMKGESRIAIKDFENALAQDSLCWQARYGLAHEQHKLGLFLEAENNYDLTLALNPELTLAFIGRGRLLIDIGNYPAALASLAQAREREPEYAPIYESMAEAYLELGLYTDVVEQVDIAVKLDPELEKAYYFRAEAYFAEERYGDADADFARSLKLDKRMTAAWYRRGQCHDLTGDLKGANKYYGKAIKLDPVQGPYYISRAELQIKMEKPKKAIADYSKAIPLTDDNTDLYAARGFLYMELEDYQSAMRDFGEVTEQDRDNAAAWYGLGEAKYQSGNVGDACRDWAVADELGESRASDRIARYCRQ